MSRCSTSRAQRVEAGPAAQPAAEVDQRPLGGDEQVGDPPGDVGRQAGPLRGRERVARLRVSAGTGREKWSIGTLSSTAPGRPEVAVQKARSVNRARSATRCTCQARLTNGR